MNNASSLSQTFLSAIPNNTMFGYSDPEIKSILLEILNEVKKRKEAVQSSSLKSGGTQVTESIKTDSTPTMSIAGLSIR